MAFLLPPGPRGPGACGPPRRPQLLGKGSVTTTRGRQSPVPVLPWPTGELAGLRGFLGPCLQAPQPGADASTIPSSAGAEAGSRGRRCSSLASLCGSGREPAPSPHLRVVPGHARCALSCDFVKAFFPACPYAQTASPSFSEMPVIG